MAKVFPASYACPPKGNPNEENVNRLETSMKDSVKPPQDMCVGIHGRWYDVSEFVNVHPGGDVIKSFIGKDATMQFTVFHDMKFLDEYSHLVSVVGTYPLELHPCDKDLLETNRKFRARGWYKTPLVWFIKQVLWSLFYFACFAGTLKLTGHFTWSEHGMLYLMKYSSIVWLAIFWKCSGYLAHDTSHDQIFKDLRVNHFWRLVTTSLIFGVSGDCWKREHNEHHVHTNTFIENEGPTDPQMHEAVFAQDKNLIPFLENSSFLGPFLLRIQGFMFYLAVSVIGRVPIVIVHFIEDLKQIVVLKRYVSAWSLLGVIVHHIIFFYFISHLTSWLEIVVYIELASTSQGMTLNAELLGNHYLKPWLSQPDSVRMPWLMRQASQVVDIAAPLGLDWMFGPLAWHLAHHTLPRLPRPFLKEATKELKVLCRKYHITTDKRQFHRIIYDTGKHMHRLASFANLFHNY